MNLGWYNIPFLNRVCWKHPQFGCRLTPSLSTPWTSQSILGWHSVNVSISTWLTVGQYGVVGWVSSDSCMYVLFDTQWYICKNYLARPTSSVDRVPVQPWNQSSIVRVLIKGINRVAQVSTMDSLVYMIPFNNNVRLSDSHSLVILALILCM